MLTVEQTKKMDRTVDLYRDDLMRAFGMSKQIADRYAARYRQELILIEQRQCKH